MESFGIKAKCASCENAKENTRHPHLKDAGCIDKESNLWNPTSCVFCRVNYIDADKTEENELGRYYLEVWRQKVYENIKLRQPNFTAKHLFVDNSIARKYHREWFPELSLGSTNGRDQIGTTQHGINANTEHFFSINDSDIANLQGENIIVNSDNQNIEQTLNHATRDNDTVSRPENVTYSSCVAEGENEPPTQQKNNFLYTTLKQPNSTQAPKSTVGVKTNYIHQSGRPTFSQATTHG